MPSPVASKRLRPSGSESCRTPGYLAPDVVAVCDADLVRASRSASKPVIHANSLRFPSYTCRKRAIGLMTCIKALMRDFCTYIKERRGCIKSIKFSELYVCVCACA